MLLFFVLYYDAECTEINYALFETAPGSRLG